MKMYVRQRSPTRISLGCVGVISYKRETPSSYLHYNTYHIWWCYLAGVPLRPFSIVSHMNITHNVYESIHVREELVEYIISFMYMLEEKANKIAETLRQFPRYESMSLSKDIIKVGGMIV